MNLDKLRGLRAEKSLTQLDMATKLGINIMTYSKKENGKRDFTSAEIRAIKDYLNLTLNEVNEIFLGCDLPKY